MTRSAGDKKAGVKTVGGKCPASRKSRSKPSAKVAQSAQAEIARLRQELVETHAAHRAATDALKAAEARFSLAISGPQLGIWEWDLAKDEFYLSPNINAFFDLETGPGTGHKMVEFIEKNAHPDDRDAWLTQLDGHVRSGQHYDIEYRLRSKDGDYVWIHARGRTLLDHEGRPLKLGGILENTTDRNKVLANLQASEGRSKVLVESAPFPLFITRPSDQRLVYFNERARDLFGFTWHGDAVFRVDDHFVDPEQYTEIRVDLSCKGRSLPREIEMVTEDGRKVWALTASVLIEYGGEKLAYTTLHDITDRKTLEKKLLLQANTDDLTGLKNRAGLQYALEGVIETAKRDNAKFALLVLDLDRFKMVNDTLGHGAGDQVLIETAQRLQSFLKPGDTLARLGADEFAIILESMQNEEQVIDMCSAITDRLSDHFCLGGTMVTVGCSIGVIQFPLHEGSAADLMQRVGIALYQAKSMGGAGYYLFDETLRTAVQERAELEQDLRQALKRDDLFLVFQPRVSCQSGAIVAAEALVRWRHAARGIIMPNDFIGIAEECGLIGKISMKVIAMACQHIRAWQDKGLQAIPVSVNLSALEFAVIDVVGCVREAITEVGIAPEFLQIEITESALFGDTAAAMMQIRRLREIGIKILIDDFGTGYSSLAYLNRLHVDKLKIDGSFIRSLGDPNSAMLVRSIIGMSKGLGLGVTAEGVETKGQADFLKALGCDEAQGYLFGRPEPVDEFESRLAPGDKVQTSRAGA